MNRYINIFKDKDGNEWVADPVYTLSEAIEILELYDGFKGHSYITTYTNEGEQPISEGSIREHNQQAESEKRHNDYLRSVELTGRI